MYLSMERPPDTSLGKERTSCKTMHIICRRSERIQDRKEAGNKELLPLQRGPRPGWWSREAGAFISTVIIIIYEHVFPYTTIANINFHF